MNALDYLRLEHTNHNALFDRIASGDEFAMEELRSALIRHIRLEESFLFESSLKKKDLESETRLAWEEHNILMELLQKLDQKEFGTEAWISKIRLIRKIHDSHIQHEEENLFPLMNKSMSREALEEIGEKMQDKRPDLIPDKVLYPEVPGSHEIK